jgi:sigma-B regulation protein RsbU (phosphoserine phosphatase)
MPVKILVVDDEPDLQIVIRQIFSKKIRENQYQFAFAHNGVEALEKLKQNGGFDLVLSDINMPQMDGLTLLAKLNETNDLLKTVMVSAYGDMKNIRTAMNRGAHDFVTKPIDFQDLEITITKTLQELQTLKQAVETGKKLNHIQQELNVATEIQQSVLPRNFSIFPNGCPFEIYAEMIPAKEVGGDFYDFFLLDKDHLGLVIGDVSGKGMPAAIFMAISQTLIKATALKAGSTSECLHQVNNLLSQHNPRAMFVTLFYGVLNLLTGELDYSNGGHNLPFILSAGGQARFLEKSSNMALGIEENFDYTSNHLVLQSGDTLVLYTDGITEAMNIHAKEFSEERLRAYLQQAADSPAEKIIHGIINEVKAFAGEAPQSDDITSLAIKYT